MMNEQLSEEVKDKEQSLKDSLRLSGVIIGKQSVGSLKQDRLESD